MRVALDISHLHTMNAIRGVGMYTDLLYRSLQKLENVDLQVVLVKEKIHESFDLVHYPFFDLFFQTLPLVKKTRTVVTVHDVIPLVFPNAYKPGIKGSFRQKIQRLSLAGVDAVITDSASSKQDIIHHLGYPRDAVHRIYLAGNPDIQKQPEKIVHTMHQKYRVPDRYLLYVGDMNYNKNLPRFIRAFSQLPTEISLVMIGTALNNTTIPEGVLLHQAIQETQVKDRVCILTDVPKTPARDLAAIYSGAMAYIQPSVYEGFGLPVLDAMQCGVPVACSNTSSLPEVAGGAALFFNPANQDDMTKVLLEIVSLTQSQRKSWIEKGSQRAKQFSWNKTAEHTYAVYKSVLEHRS